jgi:NAD(P)-dependent dehydrogenase (short-subunit alcohol dehydrogenase family)
MAKERPKGAPAQHQEKQPGIESEMTPRPQAAGKHRKGSDKLAEKAALITGGDSGIGRAVAAAFAREGADVCIVYLNEHSDADETLKLIEQEGRKGIKIAGDISDPAFCGKCVEQAVQELGRLDILVNNAAVQFPQDSIEKVSDEQLERTFKTNIFSMFYLVRSALKHLKQGSAIINTTSVTAYKGNAALLDYSSTKGAIVAFTRSLSMSLASKGIRVNAVAPGPIWTPLIPATFPEEKVEQFGKDVPLGRVGQPEEVAPCYVFLASEDSSYMTGQTLHPNGGTVVNG